MFKIVVFLFFAATLEHIMAKNTESNCECGVFKTPTPEVTEESPLIMKAPKFDLKCDADGKQTCLNMCKALAEASRQDGPKTLCEIIQNTEAPFVPSIYFRACQSNTWSSTGLVPTLEVCCKNKVVIPCS